MILIYMLIYMIYEQFRDMSLRLLDVYIHAQSIMYKYTFVHKYIHVLHISIYLLVCARGANNFVYVCNAAGRSL